MNHRNAKAAVVPAGLEKAPTGIRGLDEITDGGPPRGRPTLVCGSAGCSVKLLPGPMQRFIGDMSGVDGKLFGLDLQPVAERRQK